MGALPKEKEDYRYTYKDYKEWNLDVGERFEVINGEAYAMSGPSTIHQTILGDIFSRFHNYLKGKPCRVLPSPYDVRLFFEEDESDDTVVQPDIIIVCDKDKLGPEGCRGAPDLAIEILSPSNTAIEMERKLKLYREAGVREYWVIDSENKGLTVYCFKNDVIFTNTYKNSDVVPVSIFPDFTVALSEVFAE